MSVRIGVWIDHERARLVFIVDGEVSTTTVKSSVEPRMRLAGGSRSSTPYGPQDVASEGRRDRRIEHQLRRFHEAVAQKCVHADHVLVVGPGESKIQFAKVLRSDGRFKGRVDDVLSEDKLTSRQLVSMVKNHYGLRPKRRKARA